MAPLRFGIVVLIVAVALVQSTAAGPKIFEWSTPENLAAVNTEFDDYGGALAKNGLSLYFTSNRPNGLGGEDLWVAQRSSVDQPFGQAVNLSMVNSPTADRTPALSRDGHWLLFASGRPGGFGSLDVWAAYREHIHDDFGWLPPVNLGEGINTALGDTGPTYLAADEMHRPRIYFARGTTTTNTNMWVSEQTVDGTWAPAVLLTELNTDLGDAGPDIRHDGLQILFHSNRPGGAGFDLWVATRETTDQPFSTPINVGEPLNSAGTDRDAGLASRGDEIVVSSDRPGGVGGLDLYISRRQARKQ